MPNATLGGPAALADTAVLRDCARWLPAASGDCEAGAPRKRTDAAHAEDAASATTAGGCWSSAASEASSDPSACGDGAGAGATVAAPYRVGLSKAEAPAYVTYPFVTGGYRTGGTWARCLASAFEWHAETLNAWTMVAACALSIALLCGALLRSALAGPWGAAASSAPSWRRALPDVAPFFLLTAAVLLHAPFSIVFHLCRGMNPEVYNLLRRLDQVFIFQVSQLLAVGIGWFVYDSWIGMGANAAAAVLVAQAGSINIWALPPSVQRNRGYVVVFVGFIALCYWWPMGVQAARDAAVWLAPAGAGAAALPPPPPAAAALAAATLATLLAGGLVFASGQPERALLRLRGKMFQPFSHQLMHVAAAAAHALEYAFVLEMWRRRRLAAQLQ
ncbi:hypothetical protein Rsub_00194 [Raphidocelis subcapitata]|uniref:Uncharacterized protein n=1 Tax=Raphidocelis subcapitata TaxID=307507 RepID=A0A2V0NPP8_9CHLO|nr:hypothetical protein Rsub_00194 [Raphidocelis subcapitata]|eukprot:GBF87483.1 hypothetical protein Rsub_00194 [Raphidocelis subcapitata]